MKIILQLLVCSLFISSKVLARPRNTRSLDFTIVKNSSVPCAALRLPDGRDVIHRDLSDEEKMQLLIRSGGNFIPTLMALTEDEALNRFPSLIGMESATESAIMERLVKRNIIDHRPRKLTKRHIQQYLEEFQSPHNNGTVSEDSEDDEPTYLDIPFVLPEQLGLQRQFRSDLGTEEFNFCLSRGSTLPDQMHLRLCTICNSVRAMDSDVWPRFLNEAQCTPDDSGCLYSDNTANGSCMSNMMPIHILKKQPNQCVIMIKDGKTLVAEHWAREDTTIRVGCECNVDKRSWLSSYA